MATAAAHARARAFRKAYRATPRIGFERMVAALPGVELPRPTHKTWNARDWDAEGWVYLARDRSLAVKIGFSGLMGPEWRINEQRLWPALLISGCSVRTERALHRHFAHEAVDAEWFVGRDIEGLIERCIGKPQLVAAE